MSEGEPKILFECEGYRIVVADKHNVVVEAYTKQRAKQNRPEANPPILKGQIFHGWVFKGYHSITSPEDALTAILKFIIADLGEDSEASKEMQFHTERILRAIQDFKEFVRDNVGTDTSKPDEPKYRVRVRKRSKSS